MTLAIPSYGAFDFDNNLAGTPVATGMGTLLTAAGSAHTKGSWTSLIDPTAFDAFGFWLTISETAVSSTRTDTLLDIAIGPSGGGSEQIILANMVAGWRGVANTTCFSALFIPLYIPAGLRISGRIQSITASKTARVGIHTVSGNSGLVGATFGVCDTYGITDSGASVGTSVAPGNSGSQGTFTSLGSTTSRDYGAVLVVPQGTLADTAMRSDGYYWWFRAGSTGVRKGNWYCAGNSGELLIGPFPPVPLPYHILAGTQIQVAGTCSSASPETYDVGVYCFGV